MHGAYRIPINVVPHYPEIKKACKPLLSPQAFLPHKAVASGLSSASEKKISMTYWADLILTKPGDLFSTRPYKVLPVP